MSHTPLDAPPPPGSPPSPRSSPVLKLILIGDASTGKTSLRQRFVAGAFSPAYRATIGCDFLSTRREVDGDELSLQVWDTAGQERFRSLAPAFYRASDACILVYSLTSPSSPATVAKSIQSWFTDFRDKCPVGSGAAGEDDELRRFCWACVGAKADEVDPARAEEISAAVEETLEALLPRRNGRSGARGSVKEEQARAPTVRVEVLPPPGEHAAGSKGGRRRLPRASINGHASDPAPSASASTTDGSATSTASATPTFELDEPIPDLLLATSPPAAPAHFGRAGAPPAVWSGGPFQGEGQVLEREEDDAASLQPDHRADGEMSGDRGGDAAESDHEEEVERERTEAERFADEGIRHFRRTSAKTGEGVDEVFDYVARRVLAARAYEGLTDDDEHAGTPYRRTRTHKTKPEDVIRVNEHTHRSFGQKDRSNSAHLSPALASAPQLRAGRKPPGLLSASSNHASPSSCSTHEGQTGPMRFEIDADGRAVFFGGATGRGDTSAGALGPSARLDGATGMMGTSSSRCEEVRGEEAAVRARETTPARNVEVEDMRTPTRAAGAESCQRFDENDEAGDETEVDVEHENHDGDEPARERVPPQEDADHILLRQFSSAFSPSPKRAASTRKKRSRKSTTAGLVEQLGGSREEGTELRSETDNANSALTAAPSELAPSPFNTPARPAGPARSVSLGSALSSLTLGSNTNAAAALVLPQPAPASPPLSPLARNLIRLLAQPERLPLGLVALLEACAREGDAAAQEGGLGRTSELAVKAGLVAPSASSFAPAASSDDILMPPPSRPMQHSRTASSSSIMSLPSVPTRSRAPSVAPSEATNLPSITYTADELPRMPFKSHPQYPKNFSLRFVYETGQGSYEEQRESRSATYAHVGVRASSLAPRPRCSTSARTKRRMAKFDEEDELDEAEGDIAAEEEDDSPPATANGARDARTRTGRAGRASIAGISGGEAAEVLESLTVEDGDEEWGVRRSKRVRKSTRA